jgi:hypothetical protein
MHRAWSRVTSAIVVTSTVMAASIASAWPAAAAPTTVLAAAAVPAAGITAPEDEVCAEQVAAKQGADQAIDVHNATPVDQTSEAAVAAYNAEAEQLQVKEDAALANLQACIQAVEAATESTTSVEPAGIPPDVKTSIDQIKAKIPENFQPGPAPPEGKNWTVPKGTPLRPLYDKLREKNPGVTGDAVLRGQAQPAVGAVDPAYPGARFTLTKNGVWANADHIVPLAEIVNMKGFTKLSAQNMYTVARAPINLQWLSASANSSKQSRSVSGMKGVDPAWQTEQLALQKQVRQQIQDLINLLLKSQGVG